MRASRSSAQAGGPATVGRAKAPSGSGIGRPIPRDGTRGRQRRPGAEPREGSVQVSEVQRARILTAMARVVAEHGVGSATVARVVSCAGVSRRTFYDQFTGCEDCFLAVFEDTIERASRVARGAVAAAGSSAWREQVRAGLAALLVFCEEESALGSLLIVDALGAGPRVLERRARVVEGLAVIVDRGCSQARGGRSTGVASSSSSPSLTAEGVVGAVLSVIHARMLRHESQGHRNGVRSSSRSRQTASGSSMLDLLNPLMGTIVLPYLGQAAAQKELAHSVPRAIREQKTVGAPRHTNSNPLDGLNMRLTYRTLQVLATIASTPGVSNRQVADGAGIHDQGQISKLLTRLERLDLIHNTGAGQAQGEPNAWTLTPKGTAIQQALTPAG
jgi:AcrR family transcriptional regulator/DNA-binding MarR family transcriptional regulator